MKPYGRERNLKGSGPWKRDYHVRPKKSWVNWWETIVDLLPRTTIKQRVKKEIENEQND
jgi:hypothetical protein